MFDGFKKFISRGNVLDLAVAVVIGAAFTAIVQAVVTGLINPIIGLIFNAESLSTAFQLQIPGTKAVIALGAIIAAVISFLATAFVVYFIFVAPMNRINAARAAKNGEPEEEPATDNDLLKEIRDLLAERQK